MHALHILREPTTHFFCYHSDFYVKSTFLKSKSRTNELFFLSCPSYFTWNQLYEKICKRKAVWQRIFSARPLRFLRDINFLEMRESQCGDECLSHERSINFFIFCEISKSWERAFFKGGSVFFSKTISRKIIKWEWFCAIFTLWE